LRNTKSPHALACLFCFSVWRRRTTRLESSCLDASPLGGHQFLVRKTRGSSVWAHVPSPSLQGAGRSSFAARAGPCTARAPQEAPSAPSVGPRGCQRGASPPGQGCPGGLAPGGGQGETPKSELDLEQLLREFWACPYAEGQTGRPADLAHHRPQVASCQCVSGVLPMPCR
jgi:hypothetical protein